MALADISVPRRRDDYWRYVVFHCASANPSINILRSPATLEWQPVVEVEHYWLKANSIRHPVELQEERAKYGAHDETE